MKRSEKLIKVLPFNGLSYAPAILTDFKNEKTNFSLAVNEAKQRSGLSRFQNWIFICSSY